MAGLYDYAVQLQAYAAGELTRDGLQAWLDAVLAADPLGAEEGEDAPWEEAADEERLFWRLVYLVDTTEAPDDTLRPIVGRVLTCLSATASADDTLELLPMVIDQPRLCEILERHARGLVSRTGFLGVVANAGYAAHAKLWLTHAGPSALGQLCGALHDGRWEVVARVLEERPARR